MSTQATSNPYSSGRRGKSIFWIVAAFPVGLFESATYTHAQVRLQPGDVLACFSDGITEAKNRDGQMWDEGEIEKLLCDNRHCSSVELVQKLVQAMVDYVENGEQADDITIVTLRVLC